jgi:predicted Zn-dependent protease
VLGQKEIEERLQRVLQLSAAEATQATLIAGDTMLTRFANNIIHQNVAETNAEVTVQAVSGSRIGAATTNDLSDTGLAQAAERALAHARQQPADPDFPGLGDPQTVAPVAAFDAETAGHSPVKRAQAVGEICRLAEEKGMQAFGLFQAGSQEIAVANSQGVMAYHPLTKADLQVIVMGENGSGRARASNWAVGEIPVSEIGREAVEKAVQAQNPEPLAPGTYTVVLDPYATSDILGGLNWLGMGAQAVQEGRSWMNDRMGQQVMSPLVSIWDDGRDPAGAPLPFDFEGQPRQRVSLVEKGVVQEPVYDRYTAGKAGRETTGHAIPPGIPFFSGPLAMNLFMAAGDSSVAEMITGTERGLYITRFWYTRPVHPRDAVITGMTRDGVFLIENGELTRPVKDFRFTQSYVQAMADVQAVSRERRTLIEEFGWTVCVPAVKIGAFNFTGRTA